MRRKPESSASASKLRDDSDGAAAAKGVDDTIRSSGGDRVGPKRSAFVWFSLLLIIVYSSWAVHHYQYESMPVPLSANQAGKRGFSEEAAMKHVKALTEVGPHPVGSDALDRAMQYVLAAAEKMKKDAHWVVDVEVDSFHAKSGLTHLVSGLFVGKSLVYSDLNHIVIRILPKYASEAGQNAILVSSHVDTVFSGAGAGDCSSCVAVILELARSCSQWAHGFKNAVIFLLNTGEEDGLNGAHSFITQHPWSDTIRMAVDLEAMGIGGKSGIFQAGPHPLAVENFAMVAKYPSAQIAGQDLFSSGVIKSATDFQVYKEVAGLSGLDFVYADNGAVYHTKNDKLNLLKPGSLQHLGDNMLAFLLHTAASSHLPKGKTYDPEEKTSGDAAIYFDILGLYMVVYRQNFASMLHNSVILQSILIWTTSLVMGGRGTIVSLAISCLSLLLMWIFSFGFSAGVAFVLPLISSAPVPYVANPWLIVGLFAAPAFLGAFVGQHIGYGLLQRYLSRVNSMRNRKLSPSIRADVAKLEAERWLFKSGSVQWLVLLMLGNYFKIGSSYLALIWLVSPVFAYGFMEATLSPVRLPRPLKIVTLIISLMVPILISGGVIIRMAGTLIGMSVRFDRNPGSSPEWIGNLIIAAYVTAVICLTLVYLLSYLHLSGAKRSIVIATLLLFGLSLGAVLSGTVPPFTEDTSRALNVVHVVDTTGRYGENQDPVSYVSLFSPTPGKLAKEVDLINEGFICGKDMPLDFVTFSVKYGCWTYDGAKDGWSVADIPTLHVSSETKEDDGRITHVVLDTKASLRWTLAINTEEIEDFKLTDPLRLNLMPENAGNSEELVPRSLKTNVDGWHIIQFSGGKNVARQFDLTLFWAKNYTRSSRNTEKMENRDLLKLRTDVDMATPKTERVLEKLPSWCSLFGKSTSPHTLAFLASLPVNL